MLGFLFRGLTADPTRGAVLFETLIAEARQPRWFVEGEVPDTLDGRFAMLATLTALVLVRLERDAEAGNRASVALTERFIEVMESEHRELGLGDPTLGRTVRKLVGMLARKTELWRSAVSGDAEWAEASRESLYKDETAGGEGHYAAEALRRFWERLDNVSLADLEQGTIA